MGGSADGAELDVESSEVSPDVNWEICLKKLLFLMPIDIGYEVHTCCVTVETHCLFDGALLRVKGVSELYTDTRFTDLDHFRGMSFQFSDSFETVEHDIPSIPEEGHILVD